MTIEHQSLTRVYSTVCARGDELMTELLCPSCSRARPLGYTADGWEVVAKRRCVDRTDAGVSVEGATCDMCQAIIYEELTACANCCQLLGADELNARGHCEMCAETEDWRPARENGEWLQ